MLELIRRQAYDAVVGSRLSAEVQGLVVLDALIDDAIGEHGLGGDAEYEHTERDVVAWLGVLPHV